MKPERPLKHFLVAFLLAAIGYAVFYEIIEHARTRKGPWVVVFTNEAAGMPAVVVNQPVLGITNVRISFAGEPPAARSVLGELSFGEARPVPWNVAFGQCIFMDTTFLPGTVTLQLYGHEIELLPRVLVVDRQERAWLSNQEITLHSVQQTTNSPSHHLTE